MTLLYSYFLGSPCRSPVLIVLFPMASKHWCTLGPDQCTPLCWMHLTCLIITTGRYPHLFTPLSTSLNNIICYPIKNSYITLLRFIPRKFTVLLLLYSKFSLCLLLAYEWPLWGWLWKKIFLNKCYLIGLSISIELHQCSINKIIQSISGLILYSS